MEPDVKNEFKDPGKGLDDIKKTVGDINDALANLCKDAAANAKEADGAVGSVQKAVGSIADVNSQNAKMLIDLARAIARIPDALRASEQAIMAEVLNNTKLLNKKDD